MTPSQHVVRWQQQTKLRAIVYKGGGCALCGYSKSVRALQFHHIDPREKDFTISSGVRSWHKTRAELDKCVLLCANCHGEVHDGLRHMDAFGPTPAEGLLLVQQAGLEPKVPRAAPNMCACGNHIYRTATQCRSCKGLAQKTRIAWPAPDVLVQMVRATSKRQVAQQLGVSDHAVANRLRRHPDCATGPEEYTRSA